MTMKLDFQLNFPPLQYIHELMPTDLNRSYEHARKTNCSTLFYRYY